MEKSTHHADYNKFKNSTFANTNLRSYYFSDTRTTQWEDPRLSNPHIAGPVRLIFHLI